MAYASAAAGRAQEPHPLFHEHPVVRVGASRDQVPVDHAGRVDEGRATDLHVEAALGHGRHPAALQAAGLVDALKGEGPFTVFAPTDEAFAKLPAGTVENLLKPENRDKLTQILTYHVVFGSVPASKAGAELLFDVIATAYERNSVLVTTNLPFENWPEVLGNERLTGAALDRLTHCCHILETKGESYRLKEPNEGEAVTR